MVLKTIDVACFSVFIYGIAFAVFPFLLDSDALFEYEAIKAMFGLAIILGWLAVIVATIAFIFNTAMWIAGKAPWYWKSFTPTNFAFVILVIALFSYNQEVGFGVPALVVGCSFAVAWLISVYQIYDKKLFLLIIFPCFFSVYGYFIPLLIGSVLLFVSIFARMKTKI